MEIIGEKINGTRKQVAQAIVSRDAEYISQLARAQAEAGAHYLDLHAGTAPQEEPAALVWLVETVQAVVEIPLCLDSPNPDALAAALKVTRQTPMINSISGEKARLEKILPIVAEHGCRVIALALESTKIPDTCEARMEIIGRLLEKTRARGIADHLVYIDPLVMAVAANTQSGMVTLEIIRLVKKEFPQVHLTSGVSNISYGLPLRSLINRAFLSVALAVGLDSAIINPLDRELMAVLKATELVLGYDRYAQNFLRAYRAGNIL